MTTLELVSVILILGAAILGGFYPLTWRDAARGAAGIPNGESFTAGVFLALSLVIMMPAGFHLFGKAFAADPFRGRLSSRSRPSPSCEWGRTKVTT